MAALSTLATVAVGAAGVGASLSASRNASRASDRAAQSADAATQATLQIAQEARDATTRELRPWASAGSDALVIIRQMLGLPPAPPPEAAPAPSSQGGSGNAGNTPVGGIRGHLRNLWQENGGPPFWNGQETAPPAPTSPPPPPPPAAPPPGGAPTSPPAPTGFEASFYSNLVDDAMSTFEDSPWWQFAQQETDDAINDLDARYGASGLMLSGQALRARAEIASRLKGEAFDKHYNQRLGARADYLSSLFNLSGQGMTAASGIGSGGANYANTAANALTNNAAIRGNLAIQGAAAQNEGVANAMGFGGWALGQILNPPAPTPVTPVPGG